MAQFALPLVGQSGPGSGRIVVGNANAQVVEALGRAEDWPFGTAILFGPARSGKSLLGRWFAESGAGDVLDDAGQMDETELFHRWNRAQQDGRRQLLIFNGEEAGWRIVLPDLASRLGAALHLAIGTPDDAMLGELIGLHAEHRGLILGDGAESYLVPRCERSHLGVERLVAAIDRISLERKVPAGMAIWREALEQTAGLPQPRLL